MEAKGLGWLEAEGPKLLSDLIRFDTSNPPGNETALAEFVCGWLKKFNLSCELAGPDPERKSVMSVWQGRESDKGVILMSHLDVVPATERDWTHPPFSGQIADGCIWGRGAIDAKGVLAAQMLAVAMLKKEGFSPQGKIVLLSTADEEAGGNFGMKWFVENRPELFEKIFFVINDGGGISIRLPKADLYFLQTAEKGNCWLRLVAESSGGHGSLKLGDSPVSRIIKSTNALNKIRTGFKLTKTTLKTISAVMKYGGIFGNIIPIKGSLSSEKGFSIANAINRLKALSALSNRSFTVLKHLFSNSINVTGLKGYNKPNVIPDRAEATVDLRVLPNVKPETIIDKIRALVSNWDVRLEVIEAQDGFEFSPDPDFTSALRDVLKEESPRAELAPYMLPGSSDAKFLVRVGLKVYGFFPMRPRQSLVELGSTIHGKNERLGVEDLLLATRVYYKLLKGVA